MATIEHSTLSGSELHDPKSHTHDTLYLKRAAADISTFTEKASPVSADLVIVEDSEASYAKKKVQVGNLPGGGGVTDHGALTGLGDDDHTQYLLVSGSRTMSGNLNMGGKNIIGHNDSYAAVNNSYTTIIGGTQDYYGSAIAFYGKDAGTPGVISLNVPNAANDGWIPVLYCTGCTDTPSLYASYGLGMSSKNITNLADPRDGYAQDAATKNYVDTLAGIGTLGGLSDVTITSPTSGDTIIHDGVDFKNVNIDTRIMATKLDDFTTPNDNTDLDSSTVQHGLLPKLGGGTVNFLRADGSWAAPPGAAGGETNTASNQGVAGVGVYYQKVGVDLQFKNINAGSNQISITDDTGNHEIDIDVVEANIKLDNLGTPDDNTDLNATTGAHGLLLKLGGGSTNFLRADGTWAEPPGASGGEANTGTNVGTAGVGVFKQKTGVNLEFKKINAGSGNITITDDVANSEVDINVGTNVFLADGTVAMTSAMDMGDNQITKVSAVSSQNSNEVLYLIGGATSDDPMIAIFGKDASVPYTGKIQFYMPDAAKTSSVLAMTINGATDTPKIDILHGLDMNSKKIVSVLDPTSAQDAATKNYVDTHGGATDHGALTGLADDDHTQYLLVGGTRAMSGNLNMGSNTITSVTGVYGVSQVFAADSASGLNLVAHNTIARCPRLSMYGTTYTNPGDRGSFQFYCPGAGGASQILAMSVGGLTDSPPVYIYYGLSMMTKKITSLGDPTSAQDAATKAWVDAHNWVATDITSGTLAVARGGTGVTGDTYDADKVDGYHASAFLLLSGGTMAGNILPDATASYRDLGSSAQKWDDVYAQDVRADRIHMAGNLDMNDHLIDDVDDIQAYDGTGIIMRNSGASSRIALAPTSYAFLAYANANMNTSYKIINLAAGTSATDAVRYDQVVRIPASSAQGDILYRDGSGWTRLAAGTSGYFLKTQGASANPVWAAGGSGQAIVASTYIVAATIANGCEDPTRADQQCDGTSDQSEINTVITALPT